MRKNLWLPVLFAAAAAGINVYGQADPARTPSPNAAAQQPTRGSGQANPGAGAQPVAPNTNPNRPNAAQDRNRTPVAREDRQGDRLQGHIANCLVLGNQEEIAVSQIGLQKSQDQRVKEFAQQMINDHTQFLNDLQKFATDQGLRLEGAQQTASGARGAADQNAAGNAARDAANRPNANRTIADANRDRADANDVGDATRTAARPDLTGQRMGGLENELLALAKEAHEECLRITTQDLGKYQGHEFDAAFVGVQLGMHTGMLAHLKAAEKHVDGEFQALLQKGIQTTMQHKQHAEQLMDQIKDAHASTAGAQNRDAGATSRPATGAQPAIPGGRPAGTSPPSSGQPGGTPSPNPNRQPQ